MTLRHGLPALLLACVAVLFAPAPASAQAATSYEVRRGDSLFAVARKSKYDNVTRNQMILGIWRANQAAFPGGDINLLEVGTVLAIPTREAVASIESAEADRLVREMLSRAQAPAPVAIAKPPAAAAVAARSEPKTDARTPMGSEDSARRYREGLALERKGDDQGALRAFLDAGEAGHGLAQRRLGQIYDKGNSAVQRDYQASLRWYQKAREQGVEIDKPLPRMTTK